MSEEQHTDDCGCNECCVDFSRANNHPLRLEALRPGHVRDYCRIWHCTPEQLLDALLDLQAYVESEYSASDYLPNKGK